MVDGYYFLTGKFKKQSSFFFNENKFHLIRRIRRIGQNNPCMNMIQLEPHTSTENILV